MHARERKREPPSTATATSPIRSRSRSGSLSTPQTIGSSFFDDDKDRPANHRVVIFVAGAVLFGAAVLYYGFTTTSRTTILDEQHRHNVDFCPQDRPVAKRVGVRFVGQRPVEDAVPTCPEAKVDAGQCFSVVPAGSANEETQLWCLPSFIIAGAQKAATGWLRIWLGEHPDLAQGGEREIHYFDKVNDDSSWTHEYLPQFPAPSLQAYTYEKTPDYLPNATAMHYIFSLVPSVKLIFMLRNPTSRAYSAFHHHCRRGRFGKIVAPPKKRRRLSFFPKKERRLLRDEGHHRRVQATSRLRPQPKGDVSTDREVVFQLECTDSQWSRAVKLLPPCAPVDFDLFVRRRLNETRLLDWGFYARHIDNIRALGFTDDQLYVAFSDLALKGKPEDLLDDIVNWLGLRHFDFTSLRTYRDALGREQIRHAGLGGFMYMLWMQYNPWMFYKHTIDPILPSTAAFLDDFFRLANRDLDLLLQHRAPAIAVYPPRHGSGNSTSLLPPNWST